MPAKHQTIVNFTPTQRKLGASDSAVLSGLFPDSPITGVKDVTDDERRKYYQSNALDGVIKDGYGIDNFSLDYADAPDITKVVHGGPAGQPASPYSPNPASAESGVDPNSIPAPPSALVDELSKFVPKTPFVGSGITNPAGSTSAIAKTTLGNYLSGKSGA